MDALLFWHWWILGFGLLVAEILLPGTFCMWLGIAALFTGLMAWVMPMLGWPLELVIFAALSCALVAAWFRFKPLSKTDADNGLNQRGRHYIGQVFELVEPISHGFGKARVQDSVWRVAGPDLPSGSAVRVLAVDGTTLKVEAAN